MIRRAHLSRFGRLSLIFIQAVGAPRADGPDGRMHPAERQCAVGQPSVSMPVARKEAELATDGGHADPLRLGPREVLERIDCNGDLSAEVAGMHQMLPEI